jgi:hypothetical protein
MRRTCVAVGTAMMCSAALMAQSSMDKNQMDKDKMMKGTVMVTGCVAQGDDMNHFKLTNPTMSSMPMGTAGATEPAMKTDTGAPTLMTKWYELDGGDLKAHLGHKVEVSGTMDKKGMMDHDKMAKSGTMGDKDKMDPMAHKDMMAGKIKVKSVKMLADTCM